MPRCILVMDSHTVSNVIRCEKLYEYTTIQGYQSKTANFAQSKGTHMHNLLYLFYTGKIKKEPFNKCALRGLRYLRLISRLGKWDVDTYMLIARKYSEYVGYYRTENIQPLALEKGFSKILYESKDFLFVYEGRIDYIGKFANDPERYWVDHKSESRKEDLNEDSFQFLGYSWALNTRSGLINYIGMQESKAPSDAFRRTIVTHTKEQIEEWKRDLIEIYFRVVNLNFHKHYIKFRTACKPYACQPCNFKEVCRHTNPRKVAALLEKDFVVRENPWLAWGR